MTRRPNFFLIGAPKCGTTSLSEYLRTHPDVYFSSPKEPDHFNTDYPNSERGSDSEYLKRFFAGADTYKAIGEGSTHYLSSLVAVERILSFNRESKFIVMLRNPIEMAHSLYYEERAQLVERSSSFEEAWHSQWREPCPAALRYGNICMLGAQLERLFRIVPSSAQVMVIDFRRFITCPAEVYSQVLEFLGLDVADSPNFAVFNRRKQARSLILEKMLQGMDTPVVKALSSNAKGLLGLRHWPMLGELRNSLRVANLESARHEVLRPEFKASLYTYFKQDVALVEAITGMDLYAAV